MINIVGKISIVIGFLMYSSLGISKNTFPTSLSVSKFTQINAQEIEKYLHPKIIEKKPTTLTTKKQGSVKIVKPDNHFDVNVATSGAGMHRIYANQIPRFIGQNTRSIALYYLGNPVARTIGNSSLIGIFTADSFIDFYAEPPPPEKSLYQKGVTYQLAIDSSNAIDPINIPFIDEMPQTHYIKVTKTNNNNSYDFTSPQDDPWYDRSIRRTTQDGSYIIEFSHINIIEQTTFDLTLDIYGVTDFAPLDTDNDGQINNDHHVKILLNGTEIHDLEFDGHISQTILLENLPSELLSNEINDLEIKLVNDTGYAFDLVNFDKLTLKTDSEIQALNNKLFFNMNDSIVNKSIHVSGFDVVPTICYAYQGLKLYKLGIDSSDLSTLKIATVNNAKNYWISADADLLPVTISQKTNPIISYDKNINYLIIAHPDYMINTPDNSDFQLFNDYLNTKLLNAKWKSIDEIYDAYGYGQKTPFAIKSYIDDMSKSYNIKYVLFIGADSYDYHNVLGQSDITVIPSWYKTTNEFIYYTPTDLPYVDLNNDEVPDIAVGRWAVRSLEELHKVIINTIDFSNNKVRSLLKISDSYDRQNFLDFFRQINIVSSNFSAREINTVSLDALMTANNTSNPQDIIVTAQNNLITHINNGADLIMYDGHGSIRSWTFYQLLTPTVAQQIQAPGSNFYMPLACYTTYFNEPNSNTLAHQLLYGNDNGSAGMVGAISLSEFSQNAELARLILGELNRGVSIGEATLNVKRFLNFNRYRDVIINWATLAEPSLTFK